MSPPDDATVLDTGRGRLWQADDGVLREIIDLQHLDGKHLPQAIEAYESLCRGRPRRQLVDARAVRFVSLGFVRGSMTKRARSIIGPMGILADNPVTRMAARVFDKLATHGYPIRVFDSERPAIRWLLDQPD